MKDLCLKGWIPLEKMVLDENQRQIEQWGIQDLLMSEWLMLATEELGELAKAIGEWNYRLGPAENVIKEAIQAATLCLKIAEMFSQKMLDEPRKD